MQTLGAKFTVLTPGSFWVYTFSEHCITCVQQQGLSKVPPIFATSTEPGHSHKVVCLLLLQANRAHVRKSNQQEAISDSVLVCLEGFYALSDFCLENLIPTLGAICRQKFLFYSHSRRLNINYKCQSNSPGLFIISSYILNQAIVLFYALPHGGTILTWHIHLQGIFHSIYGHHQICVSLCKCK